MAVGDVLEVRAFCTLDEQVAINIRHFKVTVEVAGGASMAAIAGELDNDLDGRYKLVLSERARYEGVDVARIRPLPRLLPVVSTAGAGAGLRTGDALPGQVAGVCTLRSLLAGQANRGRFYAPFPAETDNTSSHVPTTEYLDNLASLCSIYDSQQTIPDGAASTTIFPVIFHRSSGTTTDIIGRRTRGFWGTQRRRGSFGAQFMLPTA